MIFCRRNCKENEGRSQGAKKSSEQRNFSGLQNFAAQNRPLRKWPSATKSFRSPHMASTKSRFGCENGPPLRNKFRSPTPPSTKIFVAAKTPLGTRVPKGGFAEEGVGLRNYFAADGHFPKGLFWAAKFRRPLKFHSFELLLAL